MPLPRRLTALWAVVVVLVLVHVVAATEPVADATYLAAVLLTPLVAWLGVHRAPLEQRTVPLLVAASVTLSGLGDLVWQGYVWAGAEPDVSWADVLYYASYLGLGAAVLLVAVRDNVQRRRVDVDAVVDALTVVTVMVLVLWTPLVDSVVDDRSRSWAARVVEGGYPVLDAVLLGLVLRALAVPHRRRRLAPFLALGVGCWLASDAAYLILEPEGRLSAFVDVGWMVGAALLASAAWWREPPPPEPPELQGLNRHVHSQLGIAILPLAVPPLTLIVNLATGRDLELPGVAAASLVLVLIALVRTDRLLRSERQAREELAVARDEALAASRAKSAFLATMSHEIRTPLNGVLGLNELLLTTTLDERQQQYAEGVRSSGQVLLEVINEVLDFSRIESGHLELEELDFEPLRLLEGVAGMVSEPAHAKGLELLAHAAPDVPALLRGDPSRLRQVLLNLASNAVKFTGAGEVLIRARLESRGESEVCVRFEISDTGIGIAEDNRARLFEPFAQADPSTTRRFGGSGLGLAICRQLVEAMSGNLGVESTVGSGSTFWFTVPLRLGAVDPDDAPVAPPGLAGLRAPVVDDSRSHLAVLSEQLQHWGMSVDVADSSHGAVLRMRQALRQGRGYDLALVDVSMPDVDGLELARWVSEEPALARTPLILMTAGAAATDARMASAAAVLTKPVLVSRLRDVLAKVVPDRVPARVVVDPRPEATASRGHVLVVDDGEVNRLVAVGILNLLGYSAVAVEDGRQALGVLRDGHYDAVLMDVAMPWMDGYQTTRELRQAEPAGRRTPVVAMTAIVADGERERCLAAGMDDYITKPITRASLAAAMERWVVRQPSRT